MKNKIITILLAAAVVLSVFQPAIVSADISQDSITYLKQSSQAPWVTMALVAAGASDIASDYLKSTDNTPLDYAKTILAVSALGQNPADFGNIDYVAALKGFYQNSQIGDSQMLMDDSFGILALSSAGQSLTGTEIVGAKNYLLSKQNPDGGWGYNIGIDSDTNSTAIVTIALLEAGVNASNSTVTNALSYLTSAQNADGGFGWAADNSSDANSTSWVVWAIRKAGQNPEQWVKGNNNPISYISARQNADGSFGRTETNAGANLLATQDAVLALSGRTLPLAHFNAGASGDSQEPTGQYHFRIEGQTGAICDKFLNGLTAYDLLVAGSVSCHYNFAGNRTYGTFFLDSINGVAGSSPAYWMYLINNKPSDSGLEQYNLQANDEVLIYYDVDTNAPAYPDYDKPLSLTVSKNQTDPGESITVTVKYFSQSDWQPISGAIVFGGDKEYQTDVSGQVVMALPAGYYTLAAEKENYIRSNQAIISVGSGVSQNVGLQVEVDQGGRGRIGGEAIIFEVTPSQLDFGKVQPGKSASQTITLNNLGTVNLRITSSVTGDPVFTRNVSIGSSLWSGYFLNLASQESKNQDVVLAVPGNYLGFGIKTGEVIFWAQVQ
ncbi:MAG: prenyltransferase/squalene oxidase repeat-containing protein [Patescibacteria group bacterium]